MKRSKFSLSNYRLQDMNMGKLVPCGLVEVLPGDSFQHSTSVLLRTNPLLAPVMHPVDIRVHHWFVPIRLLWASWENFITGGPGGMDSSVRPFIDGTFSVAALSLLDYLGLPPGNYASNLISALPLRAYALIYNEWYRDQDLQNLVGFSNLDGSDTTTNQSLLNIDWEKDYFTSSRPWETKGPAVTIPIGITAPVVSDGTVGYMNNGTLEGQLEASTNVIVNPAISSIPIPAYYGKIGGTGTGLRTDLTGATGIDINTLRELVSLQRYQEARARFGSRYTEYLRYLGIRSSDSRLQRPEYLGGGKQTIQFSEVLQTGTGGNGVASLFGHGIGAVRSNRYIRFFEEHGYVLSLISVRPKTIYGNGINRTYLRTSKEDYFQKEFQFIGQQEVMNGEAYAFQSGGGGVTGTFGWQDRYDEYRRQESSLAGNFRNSGLETWHFGRVFGGDVTLNDDFVECNPATNPFAISLPSTLQVMVRHSIHARRIVSQKATPRLM